MPQDLLARILARASDPTTIHDYTRMWKEARIYGCATPQQIAATETAVGFKLPELLKDIFLNVGNGGFGPGYGLIGVEGGKRDFKGEHLADLGRQLGALDKRILPICNWGCGMYSCLDCTKPEAPVSLFNPQIHCLTPENLISVSITSPSGEVRKVFECEDRAPRPSIIKPENLNLIPHKSSFEEFISDWANGRSLWDQMFP